MSDLEIYIKDIIANYKANGLPITMAIADISREFNLSYSQAEYEVEKLLSSQTDGGMSFVGNKDISKEYTERRFKGADR